MSLVKSLVVLVRKLLRKVLSRKSVQEKSKSQPQNQLVVNSKEPPYELLVQLEGDKLRDALILINKLAEVDDEGRYIVLPTSALHDFVIPVMLKNTMVGQSAYEGKMHMDMSAGIKLAQIMRSNPDYFAKDMMAKSVDSPLGKDTAADIVAGYKFTVINRRVIDG